MGSHLNLLGMSVSISDVVYRADIAGLVVACALEKGDLMVVVEVLELITDVSAHSAKYRPSGAYDVWFAADIMQCVAWYTLEDGLTTVIRL